jgi:hypothetical protein
MKTNFTEALQSLDFIKKAIEDAYERGYRDGIDRGAINTTYLEDKLTNITEKHGNSYNLSQYVDCTKIRLVNKDKYDTEN